MRADDLDWRDDAAESTGALDLARRLLAMLRADASAQDIAGAVRAVDITAIDGRMAGQLRALVDDAAEVATQLHDRRRHEVELAALFETAGDLSSERDLEAVLQAIVGRARTLLRTDAAYLMLHDDERGDTYMRVTDGIETQAFKGLRLEMGAGLGGLVAKSATPYSTADYVADPRFVHTVDEGVSGEGLVAIQGVPLKLGDRVIGVLFAANRRARPFTPDEVALLTSLANHAAIAIENATLFGELRRALHELHEAHAARESHSAAVERAAGLHDRLTNIVLEGGGMTAVAQTLCDVLGGGLLVVDVHGRVMAAAGSDPLVVTAQERGTLPAGSPASRAVRDVCGRGAEARRSKRIVGNDDYPSAWVTPIVAGQDVLGALVLLHPSLEAADIRSLERGALVTALILLNERTVAEAEQRMRGQLLDDLFAVPHRDPEGVRRRAALTGLDLTRPHTVLVARCPDGIRAREVCDAATSFASGRGGLAAEYDATTVVLLPSDDPTDDVARELAARLSQSAGVPVTVGAAPAPPGVDGFVDAHRDARRCLEVLVSLGRHGEAATPEQLGVYGLLLAQADRSELHQFVRRVLGPVIDYDAQRGTDLTRTMLIFFDNDANLSKTASALYLHVNTLYQRLDRISRLLGPGWRHGDDALQAHVALKLHQVTGQAPGG